MNNDCISRQAVIDTIYHECSSENLDIDFAKVLLLQRKIKALSPVNLQKTGHWEQYGNYWEDKFKCSECGKEQPKILCGERIIGHWSDYCPNCGAKMESEE